ncbi:MAG TPA: glycosyltransferase family 39 protein [Candidatus Obscuribacterales bacterium]
MQQLKPRIAQDKTQPASETAAKPAGKKWQDWPIVWLIFAFALALRLWFNFAAPHISALDAADASEYLRNARALSELPDRLGQIGWTTVASAAAAIFEGARTEALTQVRGALTSLKEVYQSGPVFPLFLSACLSLPGAAENRDAVLLFSYSFLSASMTLFVFNLARAGWGRTTAYCAAILTAVYPAFIVNSGRLYSEIFAATLLSALAWLIGRTLEKGEGTPLRWAALGVLSAALQLTRSIMCVITLCLMPLSIVLERKRKWWLKSALLIAGAAAVLMPWAGLQQLAFGKGGLIVDRVGHYNLFIGTNVPGQGFLSYPYPDGRGIEQKTFAQIIRQSMKESPWRWLKLMADKPVRLFKAPWNDFRTSIGPWTYEKQVAFHQLLMLFAALGAALAFARRGDGKLTVRLFVAAVVLIHCAYLLFITVPRYNLTAMPFLLIFAGAGLTYLMGAIRGAGRATPATSEPPHFSFRVADSAAAPAKLLVSLAVLIAALPLNHFAAAQAFPFWAGNGLALAIALLKIAALILFAVALKQQLAREYQSPKASLAAATLLLLLMLPFVCLPLRAHGRPGETRMLLMDRNPTLRQTFKLPFAVEELPPVLFLAIDAPSQKAVSEGIAVTCNGAPVEPLVLPGLALIQQPEGLKSFRKNFVNFECDYIFDAMCAPSGIGNGDLRQWFLLPISSKHLPQGAQSLTVEINHRGAHPVPIFASAGPDRLLPSLNRYSWEKAFYGVENDTGLTDARYDQVLKSKAAAGGRKEDKGLRPNILLLAPPSDQMERQPGASSSKTLVFETKVSEQKQFSSVDIQLGELKAPEEGSSVWVARFTATMSAQAGVRPRVIFSGKDAAGKPVRYASPYAPRIVSGEKLDFCLPVLAHVFPGSLSSIQFAVGPSAKSDGKPDKEETIAVNDLKIALHLLPVNPIAAGWIPIGE